MERYVKVKRTDELLIYDTNDYAEGFGFYTADNRLYYGKRELSWLGDIVKNSNNLEDLCNEFIAYKKDCGHINIAKFQFKTYHKLDFEIYGAIWTDRGLIYIAKMNDKGELELL